MPIVLPHSFKDNVGEPASGQQVDENFQALITAIEGVGAAATGGDIYQAGVVSATDWVLTGGSIVPGTGAVSQGNGGGAAWLPGPFGALVRTYTTPQAWGPIKPPALPAVNGFMAIGYELTASGSQALLSIVSGAEKASAPLALAAPPPVSAGKIRLANQLIFNNAGSYELGAYWPVAPRALGRAPVLPTVIRSVGGQLQSGESVISVAGEALTWIAPPKAIDSVFEVFAATGASALVEATDGAKFYGDFVEGQSSIRMLQFMHSRWECDGSNWYLVAGQPVLATNYTAHTYTAAEASAAAGIEVSATRPSTVNVTINGKGTENGSATVAVVGQGNVGSVAFSKGADGTAPAGTVSVDLNPGQCWRLAAATNVGSIVAYSKVR